MILHSPSGESFTTNVNDKNLELPLSEQLMKLKIKAVVVAPHQVTSAIILQHPDCDKCILLTALNDKSLWQVPLSTLGPVHANNVPVSNQNERHPDFRGDSNFVVDDGSNVFEELLQENKKENLGRKEHSPHDLSFEHSTKYIHMNSKSFLSSLEGHVIDMTTSNNQVFMLLIKDATAVVQVYQTDAVNGTKLQLVKEISTKLNSTLFTSEGANRKVMYVVTHNENPLATRNTSSDLVLPTPLFISMFGKNAALVKSPVVLLATNTGLLFYHIANLPKSPTKNLTVCCQLPSAIVRIGTIIRMKECQESKTGPNQGILSSLSAALHPGKTKEGSEWVHGLLVLAESGEGYLFVAPSPGRSPVMQCSIPHSVKTCIFHDQWLVCHTGSCVVVCDFTIASQGEKSKALANVRTVKENVFITQFLSSYMDSSKENAEVTLLAVTTDSIIIPIKLKNSESGTAVKDHKNTGTNNDALAKIQKSSKQFKALEREMEDMNSLALQLNVLLHLMEAGETLIKSPPDQVNPAPQMVSCSCRVSSYRSGFKTYWNLDLTLRNEMPIILTENWSTLVTVCPSTSIRSSTRVMDSQTFTYPLHNNLKKKCSIDFHIPLAEFFNHHKCPTLLVSVFLSLKSNDAFQKGEKQAPSLQAKLKELTVDILYFLQNSRDSMLSRQIEVGSFDSFGKEALASGHPHQLKTSEREVLTNVTASIQLPSNDEKLSQNPTEVLRYLLRDSEVISEELTTPTCFLVSPAGIRICLSVGPKEETSRKKKQVDHQAAMITVEGTDVETVLAARLAIQRRLEIHKNRLSESGASERQNRQDRLRELQELKRQLIQFSPLLKTAENTPEELCTELFKLCKGL